ncbi:UDP-N-acetylmuramoyl-L-alanyl-D-glutamate--2,6-diaminopimelate ligase [Thermogemmatispora sp.]|uniref:UDP-N-acetylmuramoyl-L-alanyl-D-glutamate--2, 6-diaminopimelate ligase n=1 Tax=Thermogemmatispora sp. TaxID=1968838 RepID=UPI001D1DD722|nr:UDP-N-acetylmuramoyl-L-alanyl-D-glutamate--2,6-diaminopimelate ligase [Thermogemmatispora sp.]MBX5450730.1 UDP-N-acetylmuramoyl-L-alanyl-D-glutamate--2,6-diaminopimelate ligase [Thermogemmatispora sp.]
MILKTLLAALPSPPLAIYAGGALSETAAIEQLAVTQLAYDSRRVEPGTLFFAVPGTHTDGRRFLAEAAAHGAVAALGESLEGFAVSPLPLPYIEVADVRSALADLAAAFYGYPARQLWTIGVTGTDGKTTTCNLICTILEAAGIATGLMTTANFKMKGTEWENTTRQSTLEALEIQALLRRMLDAGVSHVVIEATSHGLELARVRGCEFDVGVVTNITSEHLDFHGTVENYRRAKARLFEMLDPERRKALPTRAAAVLNRDDSSFAFLLPFCRAPVLDYGIDTPATFQATELTLGAAGTRFAVRFPHESQPVSMTTRLVGRFNVSNCLAAIATTYHLGLTPSEIAQGLAQARGVSGRMEHVVAGQPFSVIVDYAHTPDSLQKVLATLRPLTPGRLLVVFGSAGERDVQKRPAMGAVAAQMADFFVITDEDPREEDRQKILQEIAAGAKAAGKLEGRDFLCIADRRTAIATALAIARPGDTVLLAGKGHEQSIIVGREKLPWNERQVAREELQRLGYVDNTLSS